MVTKFQLTNSSDWSYRGQISKIATKITRNRRDIYSPIPSFDLGFTLNARFLAIEILVADSKPTWNHGGFLHQSYKLPFSTQSKFKGQGSTDRQQILLVNQTRIVEFPRLTGQSYRLIYIPRKWFKDVKIKVWQYRGEEFNFVENTLVTIEDKIDQLL